MTQHERCVIRIPPEGVDGDVAHARSLLGFPMQRPVRTSCGIRIPFLLVVAENDTQAPVDPALKVADRAPKAELRRSCGGHYDVYEGGQAFATVIEWEVEFLRRHAGLQAARRHSGKAADKTVTHAQCTESAVDFIVQRNLKDVILVGHSFGGTVICKVVEAIPERIRHLVFYAGLVLPDGGSVYDDAPPEHRAAIDQQVAESSDGMLMLPFDLWRDGFIGDADLEVARWAYQQLSPQPVQTFLDRVDMKRFYTLQVPRSYIIGTEDCVMPPGEWQLHPRMTSRLGLFRLVQVPGGHELMFSNPKALADSIVAAAGR